jgi:hypothetical protein
VKITRLEDRFKIDLDGVKLTVSPLSGRQKLEMTSMLKQVEGRFIIDKASQEHFLVKHSVKAIEGLKDLNDQDYQLSFDGGALTDECAEELLGFLVNTYFTIANTQAMQGMFGKVTNPYNGQVIEGVTVERLVKEEDEKK